MKIEETQTNADGPEGKIKKKIESYCGFPAYDHKIKLATKISCQNTFYHLTE